MSRIWAAHLRQRLEAAGIETVDSKPLYTAGKLPRVCAVVLAPGSPSNRAIHEAARQDVPLIIGSGAPEHPPALTAGTVHPVGAPERRHVCAGEIHLMPDSSRSALRVSVDGRPLATSLATALTVRATDTGLQVRFRAAWHGQPEKLHSPVSAAVVDVDEVTDGFSLHTGTVLADALRPGTRLALQRVALRYVTENSHLAGTGAAEGPT